MIVPANSTWDSGDLVPLTLYFERSGAVKVLAVVVRPDQDAS